MATGSLPLLKPETPPVPVSGRYVQLLNRLILTFDKRLAPASLLTTSWVIHANRLIRIPSSVGTSAYNVLANCTTGGPTTAANYVTYTGDDLYGDNGLPVAPFSLFPIDYIP